MNNRYQPLISIGIPTYNRASGYLLNAIERSLGQTYRNVEVIVSDNCSSDHTPDLIGSIHDDRLRYFRQERNIGPNNNFNFCLEQAKGDYFLLFHDDDMIDEDFIETCALCLGAESPVGVVVTGVRIVDENNKVVRENKNESLSQTATDFVREWFKGTVPLYLCNTLYNTDGLRDVGGFHSRKNLYDDLVATFQVAAKYGRTNVREIKAGFRRHSDNRGSTISIRDWMEESQYLLSVIGELLPIDDYETRKMGRVYFSRKMYSYIAHGTAVSKSLVDYYRVYRDFGYAYSPLHYLRDR